jgi:hypothetical protein
VTLWLHASPSLTASVTAISQAPDASLQHPLWLLPGPIGGGWCACHGCNGAWGPSRPRYPEALLYHTWLQLPPIPACMLPYQKNWFRAGTGRSCALQVSDRCTSSTLSARLSRSAVLNAFSLASNTTSVIAPEMLPHCRTNDEPSQSWVLSSDEDP